MMTRKLTPAARARVLSTIVAHVVYGELHDERLTGAPRNVASIDEVNGCCYVATLRDGTRTRLLTRTDVLLAYVQEALAAGHVVTCHDRPIVSAWEDASGSWVGFADRTRGMIHGGIIADMARQSAAALGRDVVIA